MNSRVFLASVLAGTVGVCALTAGDEPEKGSQPCENKPERLADRCRKMLDLQIAVYNETKDLNKVIESNADKKARPKDKQISVKLSEKQKTIIVEATKAIEMLRAQGAAVAFLEVFEALCADMKRVQSRLEMSDVGLTTQAIENDVIDTLKEMLSALKKT